MRQIPFVWSVAWRCAILASVASLLGSLIMQADEGEFWQPANPLPAQSIPGAPGSPAAQPDRYAEILEHPLFSADRRPWTPPASVTIPPKSLVNLTETYTLAGLALSGAERVAIVRPTNGGNPVTMREGDTLNGWTLRTIAPDGLGFSQGDQTASLRYKPPGSPHAP